MRTQAELVLSVDSDVIVYGNSLKNLVRHMHSSGADAVGGCVFVSNASENWLTRMQAVKYWIGYQFLRTLKMLSAMSCASQAVSRFTGPRRSWPSITNLNRVHFSATK